MDDNHIPQIWKDITAAGIRAMIDEGATPAKAYNTAAQWRHRKFVSPHMHTPVVKAAKTLGLSSITHEFLHSQWKKAKKK